MLALLLGTFVRYLAFASPYATWATKRLYQTSVSPVVRICPFRSFIWGLWTNFTHPSAKCNTFLCESYPVSRYSINIYIYISPIHRHYNLIYTHGSTIFVTAVPKFSTACGQAARIIQQEVRFDSAPTRLNLTRAPQPTDSCRTIKPTPDSPEICGITPAAIGGLALGLPHSEHLFVLGQLSNLHVPHYPLVADGGMSFNWVRFPNRVAGWKDMCMIKPSVQPTPTSKKTMARRPRSDLLSSPFAIPNIHWNKMNRAALNAASRTGNWLHTEVDWPIFPHLHLFQSHPPKKKRLVDSPMGILEMEKWTKKTLLSKSNTMRPSQYPLVI